MKRCSTCEVEKTEIEFYKRSDYANGLRSDCKKCYNKKVLEWRQNNQNKVNQYYRNRRSRNRNALCIRQEKHKQVLARKRCRTCGIEKLETQFCRHSGYPDGLCADCKECHNRRTSEWNRNNRHLTREASKRYRQRHYEKLKQYQREYARKRRQTEKEKINQRIRAQIYKSLKKDKNYRQWQELVGYTIEDVIRHLKHKIPKGYTWQDFLNGKLHLDHKIPISAFDFNSPDDLAFKECWSLNNLQLLPAQENLRKYAKVDGHLQHHLPIRIKVA